MKEVPLFLIGGLYSKGTYKETIERFLIRHISLTIDTPFIG